MGIARFREDHLSTIFPLYFNWFQHKVLLTKFCWWVAFLQNPKTIVDGRNYVHVGQKLNLTFSALCVDNPNFHSPTSLNQFWSWILSRWPVSLWYRNNDMANKTKGFVGGLFRMGKEGPFRTFFLLNLFPLFQIKVEPLNSYFSIIQKKRNF